jgi:signal transduction histidine kinase
MSSKPLVEALRDIAVFADLTEDRLAWFAAHAEDLHFESGEVLFHEGEPAKSLIVILEGEIRARRESAGPDAPMYIARAGQVTGMLPFSRLTHYPLLARAIAPSRIVRLDKEHFDEMLRRIPELLPRLVGVLADRIRESSRIDQQRDKLMALGKLSAGLAHELNNPASAALRAAESLREALAEVRAATTRLDQRSLSQAERAALVAVERQTIAEIDRSQPADPLFESDREEPVGRWLEQRGVTEPWKLAPALVESGFDIPALERLSATFATEALGDVLSRLAATVTAERLVREVENSASRIAELVGSIKEYSYMDQAPEQEVDIHQGIESTLTMLKFRLKKGVRVIREFDSALPRVCAHGSELNQVWTNLIDNAIDGMNGAGELRIRTAHDPDCAMVEIIDNGRGIPDEIRDRIFEPFFTTKPMGEGTGLGLDAVYRIVRKHHGEVRCESRPGETRFHVRLPFRQPAEAK